MKTTELKKLFTDAKIEAVEDNKTQAYRVYVKQLNREFFSRAKSEDEARAEALDIVLNESDRIRGFELEK